MEMQDSERGGESLVTKYITVTEGRIIFDAVIEDYDSWTDEDNEYDVQEPIEPRDFPLVEEDLCKAIKRDNDVSKGKGLASYESKDFPEIKSIILDSIDLADAGMEASINTTFKVVIDKNLMEHTMLELERHLKEEILSQCSDGWGEGFEQRPFAEGTTVYYGDLASNGEFYFSAWTSHSKSFVDRNR